MKRGSVWKVGIIATTLIVLFAIYDAIYPSDSFYEREFERISGLPYPESGVIKLKDSTYPDIHGDYSSCALIEVSNNDYLRLKNLLLSKLGHSRGTFSPICKGLILEKTNARKNTLAIEKKFDEKTGEASEWGILEDTHLAYFYFWSS